MARLTVALCALTAASAMPATAQTGTSSVSPVNERAIDPARALETFDVAWKTVRDGYYDDGMRTVDWDGVRTELRPRAARARTTAQLRSVVSEMLSRIGESHFALIPNDVAHAVTTADSDAGAGGAGDVGLELRVAEERLLVSRVAPGSSAARAGVRAGWVLDAVGGRRFSELPATVRGIAGERERRIAMQRLPRVAEQRLAGEIGSTVRLRLRDAHDRHVSLSLVRRATPGEPVKYGNLPTLLAELSHERVPAGDRCVGVIRFNIWMPVVGAAFGKAMDDLRDCAGMVIDLRGNPGGVAAMVMGIAGHFLADAAPLGVMRTRGTELRFVANPQRANAAGLSVEPFTGPLAILVDARSVSTTEMFAVGMQKTGRARVFGDTTAGQALPAIATRLPNGDVLMHVIADFTAPDGTRIEGRGAIPDEVVPLRRADLIAGRDATLIAARRWIARSIDRPHLH